MAPGYTYYNNAPFIIFFKDLISCLAIFDLQLLLIMKKLLILAGVLGFHIHSNFSQSNTTEEVQVGVDSAALEYARTITESDLKNYLSILASDALEGRDTGSRGQKMAAAFIKEHFLDNNLLPIVAHGQDSLYFQKFSLYKNYYEEVYLEAEGTKYQHLKDLLYYGNANIPEDETITLHFVGEGEERDYEGLDVERSMVAFFAQNPDERRRKIRIGGEMGAKAFFSISFQNQGEFNEYLERNGHHFEMTTISKEKGTHGENILFMGHFELLAELMDMTVEKLNDLYEKASQKTKNPYRKVHSSVNMKIERITGEFETENVLGFIEGNEKKRELIVLTAHYDHVGKRGDLIYNGADDDGSGTVAVMEIAQAFALAKKNGYGPSRSLLFMAVTGEEKGLLGSEYYSDHPVWPLDQTIANLNIDMIGRVDPAHEANDEYVYIIGSDRLSRDLHVINEQVNQLYTNLEFDYKYNSPEDPNRFYYRSDHYNFAKHNIPIIFYFNGTHADYHQPTDTIEKIRFDLLKKRTDLIFYCTWELANRQERIKLNP